MRILFVAEAFGGGVFELTKMAAEGVGRAGHTTAIAFGRRPETPAVPRDTIDPAVELIEMPWKARTPPTQLAGARRLREVADRWGPDVVHLYSAFAGAVGAAVLPRGVNTIFTPQAYAFTMRDQRVAMRGLFRLVEGFASRRATVVGACSDDEARLARQVGATRVAVVKNGIPELDTEPPDCSELEGRRVVALGRTVPQRRPEACARILAGLDDLASVAWIGGAGGSRGAKGQRALSAKGIEMTGWRPRGEVLDELRGATAYLHWTAWDGLPLSILEAMACDAVVVASDIGPNREVLGTEQVCSTESEAAELLRRIVIEPDLAARLLDRQRQRRDRFGARRMVQGWIDLYRRVCSGGESS